MYVVKKMFSFYKKSLLFVKGCVIILLRYQEGGIKMSIHEEVIKELAGLKKFSGYTIEEISKEVKISHPVVGKLLKKGKGKLTVYGAVREFLMNNRKEV